MNFRQSKKIRIAHIGQVGNPIALDLWNHIQRYFLQQGIDSFLEFGPDVLPEEIATESISGIHVHFPSVAVIERWAQLGLPIVNTAAQIDDISIPSVHVNNLSTGRFAADYLLKKGCQSFAFIGDFKEVHAEKRWCGFSGHLKENGFEAKCFDLENKQLDASKEGRDETQWLPKIDGIRRLESGTGIFVPSDVTGSLFTQACRYWAIDSRNQFFLISGHDRNIPSHPSLSAIQQDEKRWGTEAARLIHSWILGQTHNQKQQLLLEPEYVIERESTSGARAADPMVQEALTFISENASSGIRVGDVVAHLNTSRRNLERRFSDMTGDSILNRIHEHQLKHAIAVLEQTNLSITEVAKSAGFSGPQHFRKVFVSRHGVTPLQYRSGRRSA